MKLTPEDIRDAMSGISEQLITESAEGSREIKERNRMKLISAIASIVLVSAVTVSTAAALRQPAADSPGETTVGVTEIEVTTEAPEYKVPEETFNVTADIDGHEILISRTVESGEIKRVEIVSTDGISVKLADTCGQYYEKMILEVELRDDRSYEKFCVECDITTGHVNDFMRKHDYSKPPAGSGGVTLWSDLLSDGVQPLTWRTDKSGGVMIAAVVPTSGGWSAYALWAYDSASSTLYTAKLTGDFYGSNILTVPKNGDDRLSSDDGGRYALLWYESPAADDPLPGEDTLSMLTVSKLASSFFDELPFGTEFTAAESQTLDGTAKIEFFYGGSYITHTVNLHTGEVTTETVTGGNEVTKEIKTEYDGKPLTLTYTEIDGKIAGISFNPSDGYDFALADKSGFFYDKMVVLIKHEIENGVSGVESFAAVLDVRTGELDDFVRDAEVIWPYGDEGMYRTVAWQYNVSGTVMAALTDAESEGKPWGTVFAMWKFDQRTGTLERAEMDPYVGENIRFFNEEKAAVSFAQYAILWRVQDGDGLVDIVLDACEALDLFKSGDPTVPAHDVTIESAVDWLLTVKIDDVEYSVDLITGEVREKLSPGTNLTTTLIEGKTVDIYWEEAPDGSTVVKEVVCDSDANFVGLCIPGKGHVLFELSSGHFALCDLESGWTNEFSLTYLSGTPGSEAFECSLMKGQSGRFIYIVYVSSNGSHDPLLHIAYRFDLQNGAFMTCDFRNEEYIRTIGGFNIIYEKTEDGEPGNAKELDTVFSDPGDDGYTVSDIESWDGNAARIETAGGDVYFTDLNKADGLYSLYQKVFYLEGVDVSVVWRAYTDGRFTMPAKTLPDRTEFEVYDISADGYALVKLNGTGKCYIVNENGSVISGAEKIFSEVNGTPDNSTLSFESTKGAVIVSVNDPYETNGCMLQERVYFVTYSVPVSEITVTGSVELSALPELAGYFEGHSNGYVSAEFKSDGTGYICIEAEFWSSGEDMMADNYSVFIRTDYDPETGDVLNMEVYV